MSQNTDASVPVAQPGDKPQEIQKQQQSEEKQTQTQKKSRGIRQKEVLLEEYDETAELQRKRLPKIYHLKESKQLVIKNEKVEIYDIHMKVPDNDQDILWSTTQISINPFEQLRPWTPEDKVMYMIIKGRGEVVSSELKKRFVEGDVFTVEKDIRHNLSNLSENQPLVIIANYPGYLDSRDIYKPISQQYKKAADSREKFFKVQPSSPQPAQQKVEEDPLIKIQKDMDKRYV